MITLLSHFTCFTRTGYEHVDPQRARLPLYVSADLTLLALLVQVMSTLIRSAHVGPYARRLLLEAMTLLTFNATSDAPVAPLAEARDAQVHDAQEVYLIA